MFRFAPSPTGDMHIGNLRTAVINYVCAKKYNKKFILRIEDTDTARNIQGKEEEIKSILNLFGINWDEYYVQSTHLATHQKLAAKLLENGSAFKCYCTEAELEEKKELAKNEKRAYRYDGTCENLKQDLNKPFVIRLKKPKNTITFKDEIKGVLSFEPNDVDSFVILRADGTPTYNFACSMDDMCEGVSFIIRGEDHVSNTPKQEHIKASLGFNESLQYAHLPIILDEESGQKMSKRQEHSSVKWLLNEGFLPDAIANYLLALGNKTPNEIFTMDNAISWFEISNISKSPARFSMAKLRFINREHIKILDDEILARLLFKDEFLAKFSNVKVLAKLAKLHLEEASTLNEIRAKLSGYFLPFNIVFANNLDFSESAKLLKAELEKSNIPSKYEEFKLNHNANLKGKQLFMSLRLLLSGSAHGPELAQIYEIMQPCMSEFLKVKDELC
ncbi:glutamate--tRNA ligase [Campylobacter sp. 2018MI13]|uniref:glutamate--tRNA ligase n=1 Tax=Campylobacter sp. 2018MI13 TaxID=2836737 RepID=UPI001BDB57E8|nr:glutamate--tRNA ligase [Campylobacter sp. 2018MI13]MBT0882947.1 glutamate--tRNA ligase [Campylobacter sp. 2018MI13]